MNLSDFALTRARTEGPAEPRDQRVGSSGTSVTPTKGRQPTRRPPNAARQDDNAPPQRLTRTAGRSTAKEAQNRAARHPRRASPRAPPLPPRADGRACGRPAGDPGRSHAAQRAARRAAARTSPALGTGPCPERCPRVSAPLLTSFRFCPAAGGPPQASSSSSSASTGTGSAAMAAPLRRFAPIGGCRPDGCAAPPTRFLLAAALGPPLAAGLRFVEPVSSAGCR